MGVLVFCRATHAVANRDMPDIEIREATYPEEWLTRARADDGIDPDDPRSPFAHDRDRIAYMSAFRRLAGKAQVVGASDRGSYHTRLTHTLKVAQLGRRVAEYLRAAALPRELPRITRDHGSTDSFAYPILAPDPDLLEAACLAHDIGLPPFGHIGEEELTRGVDDHYRHRKWSDQVVNVVGGFEGNAQTYRTLTYLAVRRGTLELPSDGPARVDRIGLNLTPATLAATIKYPWLRAQIPSGTALRKWGAYAETDGLALEAYATGAPGGHSAPEQVFRRANVPASYATYDAAPTFEAQVMDWCDDVTYAVHDAIDFYQSNLLPLDKLIPPRPLKYGELQKEAQDFIVEVVTRYNYDHEAVLAAWAFIAEYLVITEPWSPKIAIKAAATMSASRMITALVKGVGWTSRGSRNTQFSYGEGLPMLYEGDFVVDPDPDQHRVKKIAVKLLHDLVHLRVHKHRNIVSQEVGQRRIVRELLDAHIADPGLLPLDRRQEYEDDGQDIVRVASDHIATLTEPTAVAMFKRITGSDLGAVSDVF